MKIEPLLCNNILCVNPKHLVKVSRKEIIQRVRAVGNLNFGEAHGMSKLKEAEVVEMRHLYADPDTTWTHAELAKKYNVSTSLISKIIRGHSWPRTGGPITKGKTRQWSTSGKGVKLTEEQALDIRRRYDADETCTSIAKLYGLAIETVVSIGRRTTWKHI